MLKELGHFATLQFSRFRNIINLESTIIFQLNFVSEDFPEIFSRRERERAAKRQKTNREEARREWGRKILFGQDVGNLSEQTENVANVPLLDLILELISLTYIFYFLNGANWVERGKEEGCSICDVYYGLFSKRSSWTWRPLIIHCDYCLFFLFYRLLLFLPALVLRSNSSSFPS